MKHSLKKQISVTFIGLTAITILVCLCANLLFLGRFYIGEKTGLLRSIYGMLDQASESGRIREDDYLVEFEQTASSSNIEALVIDPDMRIIFSNIRRSEVLSNRLVGFFLDDDNKINKIIFKNEDYQIQMTEDPGMKLEYIELWGLLSNGNMVVLRSPLDSIRESTKMANSFLCFVGGVAVLVSAVLISVITGRITKPILQLTDISKRMCDLDFNVRYEDTTANEIGVLGNNMNSLSKTLEKTISELKSANNELKKDNARKTEIDEMRREFLGNVSHELKTPIALIQGYAEGLKDCVNDDEESRNFYCDVIMDEAGKMNRLVKNLLELDALESGNDLVSMDRFDITELIRNCVSAQDILIKQNGIDMIFDRTDPKYVWADEFKVEQIVSNYLSKLFEA